jgi:hypothetical protein
MKARDYDELNFDERQQQIRGKAYKHGFTAFIAVFILDTLLYGFGIVWIDGFLRNMLLVLLVVTIFVAELHFRGVMYGKKSEHKLFAFGFGGISVFLLSMACFSIIKNGNKLIEENQLTEFGGAFVLALMILVNALCAFIQIMREKRTNKE